MIDLQMPFVPVLKRYIKTDNGYVDIDLEVVKVIALDQSRIFLKGIGLVGKVLHTPGYSDDSVSLVLDEGMAFVGDLTAEIGLTDGDIVYRESWKKIYSHDVKKVYPAHGQAYLLKKKHN